MKIRIKNGYIEIYCPEHKYSKTKKGWILEHRKICEDFLKRSLKRNECVHHIDLNKKNNKIENLMIFKNHKKHASWHNKLKRYGYHTQPMQTEIKKRWDLDIQ